ncbi:alpha-amylase family glycosyl hydrolase [Hydrotalea sp.]|uniref:alpha-amylase family glycosyl hydrolase n=1 Tax=Hydrotalea sp. TaxID=2881279 RepID=UPI00260C68DE|nr:alpha-amylase family glycosyl hydrolase [Hydrotalea sp.]
MYKKNLHNQIVELLQQQSFNIAKNDSAFFARFIANATAIESLYQQLYAQHPENNRIWKQLLQLIITAYQQRPSAFVERDTKKLQQEQWFLSNELAGMSLYVDRFCGDLQQLPNKLDYFRELGINVLHLMPLFESPLHESDGGYAVSNFRKVDERFGTLQHLQQLQQNMQQQEMFLMLDIVLNHTSHQHEWAQKAKQGDEKYQDFYYMFTDRQIPDQFDASMPEIFPESAPGNFTYVPECNQWVMTVFHQYQWDLNYRNPEVFLAMLDTIFFYANLGVDILRIDAPAFIWKEIGTTCQNLPQAHAILQLIKCCVEVATPGMALLGEAIVAPKKIMQYFGTGLYVAHECDFAYNATQMALQWDALATQDVRVMLAAQEDLARKPYGTSWITYTRCHDDIGLGYEDNSIRKAGYNPYEHRRYLKNYYSGNIENSPARGTLFSINPKTQDARISGTLASLCGLEAALAKQNEVFIAESIAKILMMQAQTFFLGGLPMLFYGDEVGYTNDYTYLSDPGKSYDNRWMHRPLIDWIKNEKRNTVGSIEYQIFTQTQQLLQIRKQLPVLSDYSNITWLTPHNIHVAGFMRSYGSERIYALFNYSNKAAYITWHAFKEHVPVPKKLFNYINQQVYTVGADYEYLILPPYGIALLALQEQY